MIPDQGLELRYQRRVMAERQVRLAAVLEGDQAQLLQSGRLVLRKGRIREVRQRRPAPERKRRCQRFSRALGIAIDERLASLAGELSEPVGVHGVPIELELVTRAARDEHAVAQRLAQARDVYLNRLGRP